MLGQMRSTFLLCLALALGGCGGSGKPVLKISAAASLKKAMTVYGGQLKDADARFSFAGSDELAAQIRQGARPDVFAAANTKFPEDLYKAGLVEKPVTFAANRLVLAVPAGATKVASLADIGKPGVTLAVGSPSVPVGAYTRTVLARLPAAEAKRILGNVRSNEPDVSGIVGKLTQGAVDAGFVYISDVRGAGAKLRAIDLPPGLQPAVAYGAAVVKGTAHATEAKQFIAGLLTGAGKQALTDAGFEPPPAR
ncbi:MAG: molybdate transport system substrate-binding protein [Solirubrobacteraceae bacterium]|jgi:molybdate transport system substrate-binding protein|nr:molybdate transport system substrate-binding protein [Solirubrobacteraceae bacterium]